MLQIGPLQAPIEVKDWTEIFMARKNVKFACGQSQSNDATHDLGMSLASTEKALSWGLMDIFFSNLHIFSG
jgi:hypothetical protein